MSRSRFAAIILAAGEGTRMKSALPKVLHEIAGRPMIAHVLEALRPLDPAATVVVLGRDMDDGRAGRRAGARPSIQDPPRGTGDAVRAARPALDGRLRRGGIDDVLVLFGDTPLLRTETIAAAARRAAPQRRRPRSPSPACGRPIPAPMAGSCSAPDGGLERIVEARDASPEERAIGLCNGGIMAIDARHAVRPCRTASATTTPSANST